MAPLALLAGLLLASPARAGLSCDPGDLNAAVLAALSQFESSNACGQDQALKRLNDLFEEGVPKDRAKEVLFNGEADPAPYRKPKDAKRVEMTPITAEMLDKAVAHVRARLRPDGIQVACTRDDVSGYWGSEPDCPFSVCGKLEIGRRWIAKVQNSSFQGEMPLRDADQVANSVTHELVHLLVTYFRRVYGAKDVDALPEGLTEDFRYATFFTGCTLMEANGGVGRPHALIEYTAPSDMYDKSRTGNEETARLISHGMQLCFNKKPNSYFFKILGSPRGAQTCGD